MNSQPLTTKGKKYLKARIKGMNKRDSAIFAGYSPTSSYQATMRLEKNEYVKKALEEVGLSEKALATTLKEAITSGLGVKSTNSDSISGLRLAYELKGSLVKENNNYNQQNNIAISLRTLSTSELENKLNELTNSISDSSSYSNSDSNS